MKKLTTKLKNTLFQDLDLFREGEKCFVAEEFEKAYESFIQFSEKYPNGKKFIAGRIAITLMKLERFRDAKEYWESILIDNSEREREYCCLYAECLRALGEIKKSEEICFKILEKYPAFNNDLERLFKKVSIHPHLDLLRTYMDWNERKECLNAIEAIIEILQNDEDIEEAVQYSFSLINCTNNYSVRPYMVLKEYFEKGKKERCLYLLNKIEKSMIPLVERNNAFDEILKVYKLIPDFPYSKYYSEPELELVPIEEVAKGVGEKVKRHSWSDVLVKYIPVLNLDKYFAREPQLVLA